MAGDRLAEAERRRLTIEDGALYIYTSGTTGLPKAANINHYRLMLASHAFAGVMDTRAGDRMYDCLPMYHTAGGVVATGALLVNGGSVVIREKFSAREFWDDLTRWDCTLFQYIGELCRYLVNSPAHPQERAHRLRLACGNGLRPDIWPEFQRRFSIPKIIEFYGATEGNVSLFNFEGKNGAVGPHPLVPRASLSHQGGALRRRDPATGAQRARFLHRMRARRGGRGHRQNPQGPLEAGRPLRGLCDGGGDRKKMLRDVFAKGDVWFRTGDLMRKDADGYFFFVDRIGDTFRWKGENVSTTEIEEAIDEFPDVLEANVYGVEVPGRDGRAGMAAVVAREHLNLTALRDHLIERLPEYARPLFLRLRGEIDVTATFKQRKIDLVRQGFDPATTDDPIYFNDPDAMAFVRLDRELDRRIRAGEVRL